MLLAVSAAFASAAFFGVSSALQQRVASSDQVRHLSGLSMLAGLGRQRRWRVGLTLSALAFALHAYALNGAMLALVQPIIVSGLVFGVFARGALERRLPPRATIAWCVVTWLGLAAFIVVVHTSAPARPTLTDAAWCLLVAALLVGSAVVAARRARSAERRGLLYAAAAGILFGLVAGFAKVVLAEATSRWWLIATDWPFWALVLVGLAAVLLNQRAFQSTRLSVTMPMVNIVNVMVAITFGFIVFGERLFASPVTLVVEVGALVVMGLGVRMLAVQRQDDHPADHSATPVPDSAGTLS